MGTTTPLEEPEVRERVREAARLISEGILGAQAIVRSITDEYPKIYRRTLWGMVLYRAGISRDAVSSFEHYQKHWNPLSKEEGPSSG